MRKLLIPITLFVCLGLFQPARSQSEAVRVKLWHSWSGPDADLLAEWITDFSAAEPNIQIQAQRVQGDLQAAVLAAIRTESGPDLFIGPAAWVAPLARGQRIAPLDSRIDQRLRDQVVPVGWEAVTLEDAVYAIPESLNGVALFTNSSLVKSDDLPRTVAELLRRKPAMIYDFYTTAGIYLALSDKFYGVDGLNTLGSDGGFRQYLGILQEGYTAIAADLPKTGPLPVSFDRPFRDGKTGYLVDGSWKIRDLRLELGDKLGAAPLPPVEAGKPWTSFVGAQVFFLNINANQSDAAMKFLAFVTGAPAQAKAAKIAAHIPVNPNAVVSDAVINAFSKQFEDGAPLPLRPEMAVYWRALDHAVAAVTIGKIKPDLAARDALREIENALAVLRAPTPTAVP
jgi:arabinogalactan oligomer/maltooligosaccharide transport system substrate-binding protein